MTFEQRLKQTLLLIVPFIFTIFVLWKFVLVWQVPFRLNYAEGFIFYQAKTFAEMGSIYQKLDPNQFVPTFYNPIYYFVLAFILNIFGYFEQVGRAISFVFFLSSALILGLIIWKQKKDIFLTTLSVLMFFSTYLIFPLGLVIRPDILALLFILTGIYFAISVKFETNKSLLISATFFALGFFTKQNFVFAPLAVFIWLFFQEKKRAWKFAGFYLGIIVVGVLILNFATAGEFVKQTIYYPALVEYSNFKPVIRVLVVTLFSTLPFILIAILTYWRRPKNFFPIYLVTSFAGFLAIVRSGGDVNYLMEFAVALILVIGTSGLLESIIFRRRVVSYLIISVIVISQVLMAYSIMPWELAEFKKEKQRFFREETTLVESGGEILSEDAFIPISIDKQVYIEPFTFSQVVNSGLVSAEPLYLDLESGKFEFVVEQGSFRSIPQFYVYLNRYFTPVYSARAKEKIKPFSYSLYNLNEYKGFGEVYRFKEK